MNSSQLKMCVLCWFRFKKRWKYIATECGAFSADVVGATEKYLYEVEVKITRRDFLADFKKSKHHIYAEMEHKEFGYSVGGWSKNWIPNKFFFIVPEYMVEFALKQLEKYPKYGLLTVKFDNWWNNPEIKAVKQARFLHKNQTSPKAIDLITLRMSSEICGQYLNIEADRNKKQLVNKFIEAVTNKKPKLKKVK